ncbi:response regulator receiver protein [Actinomadura harenae]|uniref:response regulator receiver protein n=1 Tax=Actinomadura harenae TaxID=2483351 RepID=UPI0013151B64|nr:response regulator receiver protein [Actinomadura harenae]
MSSGVEADIVLDAAVVLTLGMNRALGRASGMAGRGAQALADRAAGRAEERGRRLAEVRDLERALREVVERNARIQALRELGAEDLPAPLAPGGDDASEELTAWCARTDALLDEAEAALSRRIAGELGARIFAAESLTTDTSDTSAPKPAPDPRADQAKVDEALERVLARMLPDATEEDRRNVIDAARLLSETGSAQDAETVLSEVRLRVQSANDNARTRRERVRRARAEQDAREQAEAERQYVLNEVTKAFEDLGYDVRQNFETVTADNGSLVLSKGDWPDHSVRMRLDGDTKLRAKMTRATPVLSENDRRVDVEREQEWCDAFEAARERLEDAGIGSDVTWRLAPGVERLPVRSEARQTGTRAAQARARERRTGE